MRSNHLSSVMPVPGLDPGIVAGIYVFLAAPPYPPPQAGEGREVQTWMAGTSPAMTPNKWFKMSGTCSRLCNKTMVAALPVSSK